MDVTTALFLLLAISYVLPVGSQRCPHGWSDRAGSTTCYSFGFKQKKSWSDAHSECQQYDGELLKIETEEEMVWVLSQAHQIEKMTPGNYEWWTGLNNRGQRDSTVWFWTDGEPLKSGVLQWDQEEQNNSLKQEHCAVIRRGLFNYKNCDRLLYYICERPKGVPLACDVDNGWERLGGNCYKSMSINRNFQDATYTCTQYDANLVTILNEETQQLVTDLTKKYGRNSWLGLHVVNDWHGNMVLEWMNGKLLEKTWWSESESSNHTLTNTSSCVILNVTKNGLQNWEYAECMDESTFICIKSPGMCSDGWEQKQGQCYLFFNQKAMTWRDSVAFCNLRGASLIQMNDQQYVKFTVPEIQKKIGQTVDSWWIGLSGTNRSWSWLSGDPVDITDPMWADNSNRAYSDGLTKCAYIRKDDKDLKWWISADCSTEKGVICKAPSNVPVQPPPDVFPELKCQEGWIIDKSNCFKVYSELATWFEARMKCRQDLSDLAVITNEQNQKFLTGQIQQEVWIGLNDRQQEKKFVWLDQNEQVSLTYWRNGDPDNKILGAMYSENCVAMGFNIGNQDHGKWIDYPCAFKLGFVCQRMAVRNIAVGKTANQSSLSGINVATLAVDGHIGYSLFDKLSCSQTKTDFNPWWEVDLGTQYNIGSLLIHTRTDCKPCSNGKNVSLCKPCLPRLQDLRILLKNDTSQTGIVVFQDRRREPPVVITALISQSIYARYVRIDIPSRMEELTVCEVEVFEGQESSKTAVTDMSPSNSAGCAGGWTMSQDTGQCYQKGEDKLTWTDAREACRAWNANLVPVRSPEEGKFLAGIAQNEHNFWIGISAIPGNRSTWLTVDRGTISFSNWGPGEPNNNHPESEHCALEKVASKTWHDVYCQRRESYICLKQDQPTPECSDGWIKNQATNTCYKFEQTYKTWHEAESACQAWNSHLASIASEEEFKFVTVTARKNQGLSHDFWIGLHDKTVENNWEWTDGTPFSWSKWAPNQPDDWIGREDCGGITQYTPLFNDYFCTSPNMFVCERQAIVSGACDLGWEQDPNTGICYKFADVKKTWNESRVACQKSGGDLANVKSPDEQLFIYNKVHGSTFSFGLWIGASDTTTENKWEGVDGSLLTYTDWGPGEPNSWNGKEEDCADIRTGLSSNDGYWNDAPCNLQLSYVCQKSVSVPTTAAQTKTTAALKPIATTTEEKVMTTSSIALTTTPWDSRCGYLWETSVFEDFCYQINEFQTTWHVARMQCQQGGGDLLSITSQSEQSYIAGCLRSKMSRVYWIGVNDHGTEGGWGWSNGDPYFYFNWAKGEPNDYGNGEDCGSIIAESEEKYRWNDKPCNNIFGYICKKHASEITPKVTSATHSSRTSETGSLGCKRNWREYGGKCYLLVQDKTNWNTALKSCRQEGGDLASVADQEEQNFIFSQMPRDYCYDIWTNETQCITWAKRGECEINPVWMSTHCQKTCQLCYHNCSNTYQEGNWCNIWASRGECNKNPTWMIHNCAFSCGICYGAPVHGFWIGMSHNQATKTFQWSDNSKVTFTTWSKAEPNNYNDGQRICVTLGLQTGLWSDERCSNDMPGYICKMKKTSLAFTSPSPFAVGCLYDNSLGYGPFCYLFVPNGKSWNNAQEYCVTKGGNLAVIKDGHTQAFLSSELVNKLQNYWVGLKKNNDTKMYQWVNEEAVTYTLWNKDFTGNENVSCVSMRTYRPYGLWETEDCSSILPYICQIQRDGFTQPSRTTASLTTIQISCLSGWTPKGTFCYKMSSEKQSWFEALSSCRRQGADLVSIMNVEEANLIKSLVRSSGPKEIWIGLSDLDEENSYKWSDGSALTYTKWHKDEPNDHNRQEDCVEYYLSDTWNDNNCYKALAYICKQPRGMEAPATDVMETTTTTTEIDSCGTDLPWMNYKEYCYYISSNSVTMPWHAARAFCKQHGAELASIHSQTENNIIFNKVSELDSKAWIGLHDVSFPSSSWADRTSVDYVNWANGEPDTDNYMAECVAMNSAHGVWYDEYCNIILPFVCKRPIGGSNVTPLQPTQATVGGCLPDFFVFGSKCFLIQSKGRFDWIRAKNACTKYGPGFNLASINSRLEQVFLVLRMREAGNASVFIGLNDLDVNGKYDWLDNSPVLYSNFIAGEPSKHAMEYCVEMHPDGTWNNLNCASMRGFVCQGPRDSSLPEVRPTVPNSDCPADYTMYSVTEQCYKILNSTQSWFESLALCHAEGASLATIADIYDMSFLELLSATNAPDAASVWIGLNDNKVRGDFEWISSAPVTYTNWDYGEPNLQENMCVAISEGFWKQISCNSSHPAICQTSTGKSSNSSMTTTPSSQWSVCSSSMTAFGEKCYLVVLDMQVDWSTASQMCRNNGMTLASIHSNKESEFVKNQTLIGYPDYNVKSVWIGLVENPLAVTFSGERWFFWTDMTPLNFFKWDDGEPNAKSNTQACVELSALTGAWYDDDCSTKKGFVCKGDSVSLVKMNTSSTPISGKPSVVTPMDVPSGSSVTTFPIKVPPLNHSPGGSHTEHSGLTLGPGQIVGIIIGILGALIALCVCIYVYVQGRGRAFYVFRKGEFANALYKKDKDSILVETDSARVGLINDENNASVGPESSD